MQSRTTFNGPVKSQPEGIRLIKLCLTDNSSNVIAQPDLHSGVSPKILDNNDNKDKNVLSFFSNVFSVRDPSVFLSGVEHLPVLQIENVTYRVEYEQVSTEDKIIEAALEDMEENEEKITGAKKRLIKLLKSKYSTTFILVLRFLVSF